MIFHIVYDQLVLTLFAYYSIVKENAPQSGAASYGQDECAALSD